MPTVNSVGFVKVDPNKLPRQLKLPEQLKREAPGPALSIIEGKGSAETVRRMAGSHELDNERVAQLLADPLLNS